MILDKVLVSWKNTDGTRVGSHFEKLLNTYSRFYSSQKATGIVVLKNDIAKVHKLGSYCSS